MDVPQGIEEDDDLEEMNESLMEDWDLLDELPEDLDDPDEDWDLPEDDEAPTMVHEEGKVLVRQAREVLEGVETSLQEKLLAAILELEQVLQDEEVDRIRQAMNQVTDLLIDAEL